MGLLNSARLIRHLGIATFIRRGFHVARARSGWLARLDPTDGFGAADLASHLRKGCLVGQMLRDRRADAIPFFFDSSFTRDFAPILEKLIPLEDRERLLQQANGLESGRVRFFSHWDADLGDPIDWHVNPQSNKRWDSESHWCQIRNLDPAMGDVKMVWEASRFSHAFLLVRAFALTNERSYLELCLKLIEEWIDANPPARGVHWNCGQETAFRLIGWCFALHASYAADVLDRDRFAKILASIYRQTQRIERHIGFARSIANNHALSEAAGLYTVGRLFPEFDNSKRWIRKGKRILCTEILRQVFADGSYIQHSMNYHRVMLHDCLWAMRLADIYDDPFPDAVVNRLRRAVKFARDMQDAESGRLPNYGSNDGAQVLPLTSCDYLDHRPVLQSWSHQLDGERAFETGPWDEEALWLFGTSALRDTCDNIKPKSARYEVGGYYTLRGQNSWAMVRCHSYKWRPAEADMLHLDLWHKGENVLRDGGSFSYNCPAPFGTYFKSTAAHNTVTVEGQDQMVKGPRFMWFDWVKSRLIAYQPSDGSAGGHFEAEHFGYRKRFGVTHRRRVEYALPDHWMVVDQILGDVSVNAAVTWHIPDVPYDWNEETLTLMFEVGSGHVQLSFVVEDGTIDSTIIHRAFESDKSASGWESLYYGEKQPRPAIQIALRFEAKTKLITNIHCN